jgi:hypothetical protein
LLADVIGRDVAARVDAVFAPTVRVDFCCVRPDWGYVRGTPGKGESE